MEKNKLNKLLLGSAVLLVGAFTSCDDYLTIYPTDSIVEEHFWQTSGDVDNARAAAYYQMTTTDVTDRILVWGEMRSDDVTVSDMSKSEYVYLRDAILQPTSDIFKWAPFYTGINYCNKVLENGQRMVDNNVDPSFSEGEWRPIKAEMQALRALYYFYLVRAFRDVPFVTQSVSTDVEAMEAHHAAVPGVIILDSLINELEVAKEYGTVNYGSSSDNKGRFTKRSIRTLLADMYLWRGCMLINAQAKGDTIRDAEGNSVNEKALAASCFNKCLEHTDVVLKEMKEDYDKKLNKQLNVSEKLRTQPYPLGQIEATTSHAMDLIYNDIFGSQNSDESILELQYDGDNTLCLSYSTYLYGNPGGAYTTGIFSGSSELFSSVATVNPAKGFGATDIRYLSTTLWSGTSQTTFPIVKNVLMSSSIKNLEDVSEGYLGSSTSFRANSAQNANWPIYRLSDLMLIRAEALARSKTQEVVGSGTYNAKTDADLYEGFVLVNSLFARYNPKLDSIGAPGVDSKFQCDRLVLDKNSSSKYYEKGADALLQLVYQERQREFVGEGKRWFDLARQVEFKNSTTDAIATWMGATKSVQNRLRTLWSMYNPIHSDEIKVNGEANGGLLKQNPTWDRYSK